MKQFGIVILVLVYSVLGYAQPSKKMPLNHNRFITGAEQPPDIEIIPEDNLLTMDFKAIGETCWDMQSIGSIGNLITRYGNNGFLFMWTKAFVWPEQPAPALIFHNWFDDSTDWFGGREGMQISLNPSCFFPSLDIYEGNRITFAYNSFFEAPQGRILCAIEWEWWGLGFCDFYTVPNELNPQTEEYPGICLWPQIAIDRNNVIHIIMHENTNGGPLRLAYTRSQDEGSSWITPLVIDTCTVVGAMIESSPVSDRVVIAYHKPSDLNSQWHNDIVYIESEDGITWDFENDKINLTNYANDNDSLWAYTDLDLLIDTNDNINITWNAQWVTQNDVYYRTYLYYYNEDINSVDEVCHHPDSLWADIQPAWHRPICKMNLAQLADSSFFMVWTQYDTLDIAENGLGNGDIYYSIDSASIGNWSTPCNLTRTITPNCFAGGCASETYASLICDNTGQMHMEYLFDKDPGSAILGEGAITNNKIIYLEQLPNQNPIGNLNGFITESDLITPIESVFVEIINEGYSDYSLGNGYYMVLSIPGVYSLRFSKQGYRTKIIHNVIISRNNPQFDIVLEDFTGIDDESPLPHTFSLAQNYPNPFNATTIISFTLDNPGAVKLEIFDITGAKVQTLLNRELPTGNHQVYWNADEVASGMYFYKLKYRGDTIIRKALLIK